MHFALILVLIIFKHPKYTIRKKCVDMCARHGRRAIEVFLSEKWARAKKRLGNAVLYKFIASSKIQSDMNDFSKNP